MSKGKIAAQVGHACLALYKKLLKKHGLELEHWETYDGSKKIALKCKDLKELDNIKERAKQMKISMETIIDAGKTEVAAGSLTVMALFDKESRLNQVTGHLKTL